MFMHSLLTSSLRCLCVALLAMAVAAPSAAEGDITRVLKGKDVNEANLLEALTPDEEPVLTRSLKVGRDNPVLNKPARRPSASLLITFETNSSEITARAKEQLDVVAAALRNEKLSEFSFNIEGHADPRGQSSTNLTLSQLRADSVRQYLVDTHSISPERLKAQGKGDRELLNPQVPAAAENRRVTIVTNTRQ
jgi:OmpA-OmpF porin, OOP family